MSSYTVAVLGGGISGLAAACRVVEKLKGTGRIVVVEAAQRAGGWASTTVLDEGHVLEHGVRSVRLQPVKGWSALDLACTVGLADQIIWPSADSPAAKTRFVYSDGKLQALPNSIISLLRGQSEVGRSVRAAVLKELTIPRQQSAAVIPVELNGSDDETVHSFMVRRLGAEVANLVMDPLCRGIYAGDPHHLSLYACFPLLRELEQQHGSLVKGALLHSGVSKQAQSNAISAFRSSATNPLLQSMKNAPMWSLKKGMGAFVDGLVDFLKAAPNVEFKLGHKCVGLVSDGEGTGLTMQLVNSNPGASSEPFQIHTSGLLSAIPGPALAPLLRKRGRNVDENFDEISKLLNACQANHVAVANLVYNGNVIPKPGFGYLVPAVEKDTILGTVFDSCGFPQQEAKNGPWSRLTVMMGGAEFTSQFGRDPDTVPAEKLQNVALDAMHRHLGIKTDPVHLVTRVNKAAIPQYSVGHKARVERLRSLIEVATVDRLELIGASFDGVSVNECVTSANAAVSRLLL